MSTIGGEHDPVSSARGVTTKIMSLADVLGKPNPRRGAAGSSALAHGKMTSMLTMINTYKTYPVMADLLLVVLLEKSLGLDVPGMTLGDDWMLVMMNAVGLGTLRHGVGEER